MSTDKSLLSICIPTYNRVQPLELLLKNLLTQCAGLPVQIVVSDNCSGDGTESLCRNLAEENKCLIYFCQEKNIGFAGNLKKAIERSTGSYIWTLGDDDLPKQGSVKSILDVIKRDVGWIIGNFRKLNTQTGNQKIGFLTDVVNSDVEIDRCLAELGIWASFMSVSIFHSDVKKIMHSVPENDFYGFSLALAIGARKGCYIYDGILVDRKVTPFRQHRFDNSATYIFDFFSVIDLLVIDKKITKRTRTRLANQMSFTISRLCFRCKINDVSLPPLKLVYEKHSGVCNFWLLILPVYFIPSSAAFFLSSGVRFLSDVFRRVTRSDKI